MTLRSAALGTLVDIKTGKLDANASSPDGAYPFFTCAKEPLRIDRYSYDLDAVLVAGNGDLNVKHYVGKFDAYQRTYVISRNGEAPVHTRYLYYFLDSYLDNLRAQSIGGVIKYIKIGMLTDAQIPLPSFDEQRRIATILDQADLLRRKRKHALDLLGSLTQSIFLEMFGSPESNPKGWKRGRISDLLEGTQYGTGEKASERGSFPILRMGNLTTDGRMDLEKLKYIDLDGKDIEKYTVKRGDILFNRTNSADLVGKTAVFEGAEPLAFAGYLVRARVKPGVSPYYVSTYLNSRHGKATLRGMAKSIVGMANINAKEMQSIPILIPDIQTQRAYEGALKSIAASRAISNRHFQLIEATFSSLQSRAFSGQL